MKSFSKRVGPLDPHLIYSLTQVSSLAAGHDLKALATVSVGYEHLDQPALKKAGIRVGYTPDVLTDAVADLTIMLLLMASRHAGYTVKLVQDGEARSFVCSYFGHHAYDLLSAVAGL
jgi:lactate dehydrogenase-like 2-hydroxyacid dehydrogenase